MVDFSIIPLSERPEFLDACVAWSYGEWGSQVPTRDLLHVRQTYEASIDQQSLPITWVAITSEGKPAGMIRLKEIDHIEREELRPWLSSLYVHPRYRGQGIAEALCGHVHTIARDIYGYDRIYLFTGMAEGFYKKLGYERIGMVEDRSGFFTEGEPLMMKTLT